MARFLVDEDLPGSLVRAIRQAGISAEHVRDIGLRGAPDEEVLRHAAANGLVLLTGDLGFGNPLRFPPGSHAGIVIVRFSNDMPVASMNKAVLAALKDLSDEDMSGNLAVIEPGRVRLRKKG
ncbi:MAG: DUF5615 family PIN-like protein [Actinomycetota bacterium]